MGEVRFKSASAKWNGAGGGFEFMRRGGGISPRGGWAGKFFSCCIVFTKCLHFRRD